MSIFSLLCLFSPSSSSSFLLCSFLCVSLTLLFLSVFVYFSSFFSVHLFHLTLNPKTFICIFLGCKLIPMVMLLFVSLQHSRHCDIVLSFDVKFLLRIAVNDLDFMQILCCFTAGERLVLSQENKKCKRKLASECMVSSISSFQTKVW